MNIFKMDHISDTKEDRHSIEVDSNPRKDILNLPISMSNFDQIITNYPAEPITPLSEAREFDVIKETERCISKALYTCGEKMERIYPDLQKIFPCGDFKVLPISDQYGGLCIYESVEDSCPRIVIRQIPSGCVLRIISVQRVLHTQDVMGQVYDGWAYIERNNIRYLEMCGVKSFLSSVKKKTEYPESLIIFSTMQHHFARTNFKIRRRFIGIRRINITIL